MAILTFFLYLYLGVGILYSLYLLFNGSTTIWWTPINILAGPIMIVYIFYKTKKNESLRR